MEELSYTSKYDGETTDKILDNAKAIMEQTTAEDGETVQVYDADGVPHKISKTELVKKSTLALPALEDISAFVAVNAAGNAVGVMTKEQVASVLAELIPYPFMSRGRKVIDANDVVDGYYYAENGSVNTGGYIGVLMSIKADQGAYQMIVDIFSGVEHYRSKISNGAWTEWS